MPSQRPPRLEDLYVVRTPDDEPLVFKVGEREVAVHVVKLNQPDGQAVERRALAAKARRLMTLDNRDSDEYLAHYLSVRDVDDPDELIAALVQDEMSKPMVEIEARLRGSDKWAKDELLESLELAWYGEGTPGRDDDATLGLMYLYNVGAEQSDDLIEQEENDARFAEAARVHDKLQEYQDDLTELLRDKRDEIHDGFRFTGDPSDADAYTRYLDNLRNLVVQLMVRIDAETVFTRELLRQRVFYATRRVDDWHKRYFATLAELDVVFEHAGPVILQKYQQLSVGDLGGKGLPQILGSSPPFGSFVAAATSTESGLANASA